MILAAAFMSPAVIVLLLKIVLGLRRNRQSKIVAFFHPNCCDGGGGERVFWSFIDTFLNKIELDTDTTIVVYCGHTDKSRENIFDVVEGQFNIKFSSDQKARLSFCYMHTRFLLNPKLFPFATMIFQAIAAMVMTLDCLLRITPDIFIDTCGIAYGYPLVKLLGGCSVVAYVHYPHISTDMMNLVREQRPSYNNDSRISKNTFLTYIKLAYYIALGKLYSYSGLFADTVIVNSSWTENHIADLWDFPVGSLNQRFRVAVTYWGLGIQTTRYLVKIYPPCNIEQLLRLPIDSDKRARAMLSVAQFRPEKGHILQLLALKALRTEDPKKFGDVKLYLLGSSRNEADARLVDSLKKASIELGLSSCVEFVVNAPYARLRELMQTVSVGIHCMWNEHFGISIVEMMAAGMIMVAHNSGGPEKDIMVPLSTGETVGYVAASVDEYADKLAHAFTLSSANAEHLRMSARQSVKQRFGDDVIEEQVVFLFQHILKPLQSVDTSDSTISESSVVVGNQVIVPASPSLVSSSKSPSRRKSLRRKSGSKKA